MEAEGAVTVVAVTEPLEAVEAEVALEAGEAALQLVGAAANSCAWTAGSVAVAVAVAAAATHRSALHPPSQPLP